MVEKKKNEQPYEGIFEWKTKSICRHLLYEGCDMVGALKIVGSTYRNRTHRNFMNEANRQVAFGIMIEFYEIMSAQVQIWPMFGTLLGLIRDGGLIPHDDDLDFGYLKKDEVNLISTLDKLHGSYGYEVIRNEFNNLYSIDKNGFLIDLYEYEDIPGEDIIYQGHRRCYDLARDELFPLKKEKFAGYEFNCINDPIKFLERYYGNWKDPR